MHKSIVVFLTTLSIFSTAAFADTIYLKSGMAHKGKIYQQDEDAVSLVVDSAAGITSISFPVKDVEKIEKETGGQELLSKFSRFVSLHEQGDRNFNGGSYYQAIESYKQAAEINPKVYSVYYNIGMAYAKLGLGNEARQNLQKALDMAKALKSEGQTVKDFIAQAEGQLKKIKEETVY